MPLRRVLPLALLCPLLAACADDTEVAVPPAEVEPVASNDLLAAAHDAGLTAFVEIAELAGLVGTLQGEGPYTVFAPTNEAFGALPQRPGESLALPSNRPHLERLLRYHIVEGRIGTDVPLPMTVGTLEGGELTFASGADGYIVRDAAGNAVRVVTPDVNVTNGVVHVVAGVLTPPDSSGL